MTVDDLWVLVERARERTWDPGDIADVTARMVDVLVEVGPERIGLADVALQTLTARAYGWDLWGAAYLLNGGCSDDGFDYFLGWLVGQGREVFDRAVADPDSLADVVPGPDAAPFEGEEFMAAPWTAYERVTGDDLPDGPFVERPDLGVGWDFDSPAEMRHRYPRLWAMFG